MAGSDIDLSVFDAPAKQSGDIDLSVFDSTPDAAQAEASIGGNHINGTLAKFFTKPIEGAGNMLMDMARTAGGAAAQTAQSVSHGDFMSPITALNRGFVSGGAGLIDTAGNALLGALGTEVDPATRASWQHQAESAGLPTKFDLTGAFNKMNQESDAGFAAKHPQPVWGAPQGGDTGDISNVGAFIGQLFGPGIGLAKQSAPAAVKIAEALATGEGYGVATDMANRYTGGAGQDIFSSLYEGLPMALVGGGLGAITHAGSTRRLGGIDVRNASEPGGMNPRDRMAQQIDAMFAEPGTAAELPSGRHGAEQDMLDQAWKNRFSNDTEGGWGEYAAQKRAQREDAATALMDAPPLPESLKDIQQRGHEKMRADDVARQVDNLFDMPAEAPGDPLQALKALLEEHAAPEAIPPAQDAVSALLAEHPAARIPRLDQMTDRLVPQPGESGTRNQPRSPADRIVEQYRMPSEPTPPALQGEFSKEALNEPSPPAELPPMVQMLLDAKADAGQPERLRGFNQYRRQVTESLKQPHEPAPPPAPERELTAPSQRDTLAAPPSWNDLTVGELKRPEYAHVPGKKAGIRKVPDVNKLEFVDKKGNVVRGSDGKLLHASYGDNNQVAGLSGPTARLLEHLKKQGFEPVTDVSANIQAKKGRDTTPPPRPLEPAIEPKAPAEVKQETAKAQPGEEQHRTGIDVPAHTDLEARGYESWKPARSEHKSIVDPIDADRRSARQAYIQQRFAELKADKPESARAIDGEKRADKKANPKSKDAQYGGRSETSEKYRAQFAREFDTQFNKQLDENPGGVKEWLAGHDKYKTQNAKKNTKIAKEEIDKKGIRGLLSDEKGGVDTGAFVNWFVDPIAQNHAAIGEKLKKVADNFDGELTPQALKRLAGMQTNSDIVRQYDPRLGETRNKFMADLDHASTDVEDPRTQAAKDAWHQVLKTGTPSDVLDARTNQYLQDFQRISGEFVDQHLKPRIDELKAAGVTEGLAGKGRLLRILQDDLHQLRGKPGEDSLAEKLMREARGGYFRAIFLGNHEVAGLHVIEAMTAGITHDPVAMTKGIGLATRALANKVAGKADVVYDFMTAHKSRGMETHLQDSEMGKTIPVLGTAVRAGTKINDAVMKKLEALPGGATAIDFIRAQLPEKAKIQTIRVAMAVKAAGDLKYPGGPETLMKDLLDSARHKAVAPSKQAVLDKARIQIYNDMNRLIMYSPLGFTEKTVFQRHGEMVKMLFPFTRSVVQQARLVHSFGEDLLKATGDAVKDPTDAKAYGRMMQAVGRTGAFIGITALFAGGKAIPREADDELRRLDPKAHKDLHEALDALHSLTGYGQTVEHLQPKLTAWHASANSRGGIFESVKKIAETMNSKKKTSTQKLRAATAGAAFFQIDSVMGLIGTQKAFSFFTKLGDGMSGHTTKYAFSEDERYLGKRRFKTDAMSEALDWFLPGVPDVVSKWIDQKQEADHRKHSR